MVAGFAVQAHSTPPILVRHILDEVYSNYDITSITEEFIRVSSYLNTFEICHVL